ncbi:MAG: right-handed parallel beta-helix repeat-containing protein, partial [Methanobrevibacter sp.]|uniref:right-handed parallel beta-helix repeat-containing protein n=1 Tax=Methanobrevibacter sp. TaxID=66852 RepID=UPI001B71910C
EAIATENHIDEVFTDENENSDIENYTTLSNDINKTNDKETLTLKNDYQYDLNKDQKTITITKSITIEGNGHYIDGNNANGFFTINAKNVTLKNIIFKNAKTDDSSIIWNFANGKLINCTFENINVSNGAIRVLGNNNIISDCAFINCASKEYAGAIYANNVNLTVMNCYFSKNSNNQNGGSIYSPYCNLNVLNCSFEDCYSSAQGGAISTSNGNVNILNSNFTYCSAGRGGSIYSYPSKKLNIANCNFVNSNSATDGGSIYVNGDNQTISNCKFVKCNSEENAGAIFISGAESLIELCSFTDCSSKDGGSVRSGDNLILYQCQFVNSNATEYGGSIYANSNLTVIDCTFTNSQSTSYGSSIFMNKNNLTILYSDFNNCPSDMGSIYAKSNLLINNSHFKNSGKLYFSDCKNLTITHSTFTNNDNPAINLKGVTNATISDSNISSNARTIILEGSKLINISNNNISGNDKCVVDINGGNCTISNNTIDATGIDATGIQAKNNAKAEICDNEIMSRGTFTITVENSNATVKNNELCSNSKTCEDSIMNNGGVTSEGNTKFYLTPSFKVTAQASLDMARLVNIITITTTGKDLTGTVTVTLYLANGEVEHSENITITNGKAVFTEPFLAAGKYAYVVNYNGDNRYNPASEEGNITINKHATTITPKTAKVDYGYAYKVLVKIDGKSVGAGKEVALKIAGKTLKAKTDKNGYATFKLAIKPKKYSATVMLNNVVNEFKGTKKVSVTVKNVIKAKNVKVKKSSKKAKVKATLKTSSKKAISGKKIVLKIKGKKVTAKTNKKGVATFKIKKNILKKLKAGKKYKYQVIYGKDTVKKIMTVKK